MGRACASLVQLGSAWRSSLGQGAQHFGIASALTRPGLAQLCSVWLSLAQRPTPRALWACKHAWQQLRQLGSAWLSLAQLGSAWLSLAQPAWPARARLSAVLQPFRARVRLSLAQLRSAWLSAAVKTAGSAGAVGRAPFSLVQLGSAWLSLAQQAWPARAALQQGFGPPHAQAWLSLVQLGSAWLSARRAGPLLDVQARLGAAAAAWLGLAQLGSAWLSLA